MLQIANSVTIQISQYAKPARQTFSYLMVDVLDSVLLRSIIVFNVILLTMHNALGVLMDFIFLMDNA